VPHSPQKRLPAGLSAPHCGQRFASAAPQSPQNFFPIGFSIPHLEQRTRPSPGNRLREYRDNQTGLASATATLRMSIIIFMLRASPRRHGGATIHNAEEDVRKNQ
jgi:hypothetical protein